LVIVALAVTILGTGGPGLHGLQPFNPAHTLNGKFSDITLAMVYTVVIFTGFESAAVLGEESRNPRRIVPRGIFGAVIIVGIFYLLVSYSESQGVAPKDMAAFAANPNELSYLSNIFWNSSWTWLIDLVVALSTMAFVLAAFNSAVRLVFAMGREHMLPRQVSALSKYKTPHVAVAAVTILALVIGLPVSITQGGFLAFAYIGALSGLSLILLFISVSVAVLVAFRRQYKADFNPFLHVVLPILGIITFGIPLVGTFYPVPSAPYNWLPYIALAWLVIGIIVAMWLGRYRAEALSRIGRIFLVEGPEQAYPSAVPPDTRIETAASPTR
jgi:amino acid transporter